MLHPTSLDWLTARPIAHRGLHDGNRRVVENSLPAFEAAIASGFAIECDIQISADGVPVIFHDTELDRLTEAMGPLGARDATELTALRLNGGESRLPSLADLFVLTRGRVPLVVEMKGTDRAADTAFVSHLKPLVTAYDGPLALMSFDAWLIEQALAAGFDVPVGLTAEGTEAAVLAAHRAVYDGGCRFTSYNVHHLPNAFVRYVREECRAPVISWTVRSPEEEAISTAHADQITFEGFLPQA
ncbi:glycerophosphodiester phosphodiesterase family protein [Aurantimonas sp. MSK8Z-1]|uniref:glycerophosphodiester phosphodiesterase family protein n=1 Tax=Mangrovibrevibacter kandeliae TaxID=2968473 RepID=UPI002118712D|nr:glycerophosphodiester phosphodiesterase family protein [Aurantimonas sp. MSK8Z-1]MCW4114629.1 glycerophosphodiester phosphodiesterase family protein [Aurantimonas sp. MSK8Z-1]